MTVDRKLLEILRCPVTKQSLFPLPRQQLERINRLIDEKKISYADGRIVDQPLTEALITNNRGTIYRVDNSIPVMLEDLSIATEQLPDF